MKRKFVMSMLMCLVSVLGVNAAVVKAQTGFNGTWVLDKSKSTDVPPNTDITMTIVQTGSKIEVTSEFNSPRGNEKDTDVYILNGKATEVVLDGPNGTSTKGTRTAKKVGAKAFESMDEGTFNPPGFPPATVKTSRKWQLSADGKMLTLEISRQAPHMSMSSKRIFVRK
jgi:flagellin-like hook-associated protein FlgL